VLLATVPSVIRVDDEGGLDGDFWRLTEASARKLCAAAFPVEAFDVTAYGNVMACAAFLYGMSVEEMQPDNLDHLDPNFPLVIAIRAVKPQEVVSGFSRTVRPVSRTVTATGHRAVILAYHRVAELSPDSHALCTPPGVFREHMAHIRRDCSPIGLQDLVRAAAAGRIPDRAVAVTLDDGYLDALMTASPILSELGIPATFFVNSDRLTEAHERWWDTLERVFLGADALPALLRITIAGQDLQLPATTAQERADALECLNRMAWPLDANVRAGLAAYVTAWSGVDAAPRSTHRVLTDTEIRTLAGRPGHSIAAHTVHHLALTTQPADTKRTEIFENKAALEHLLQQPVRLFSYPYGELDASLVKIAREAGFLAAVTIETGFLSAGMNRLLLPRVEITPRHHAAFALRLHEMFEACPAGR
jgi:peptidoglycan/xylan/chitin deacetylase (PgdA/CDA1 family)